jgi:hypothetical protein
MIRRPSGRAVPPAGRMRLWRKRQRARGLKPVVSWVARSGAAAAATPLQRRVHEAKMLALCVMTVEKIDRIPTLLDVVYRNFERWESRERIVTGRSIRLWRKLLAQPWPRIAELLTEQSKAGLELRTIAPLFGVLTARERRRIARAFQVPLTLAKTA